MADSSGDGTLCTTSPAADEPAELAEDRGLELLGGRAIKRVMQRVRAA